METFALLQAFVACEAPEEYPELRSQIKCGFSRLKSALVLGAAGCIAAASMLVDFNIAHAAVTQKMGSSNSCSTAKAIQKSFIREGYAPVLTSGIFGGETKEGVIRQLQQYGVMPLYVLDIAPAIAFGIGLDAACSHIAGRRTSRAEIAMVAAPASSDLSGAKSKLPDFGTDTTPRKSKDGLTISSIASNQAEPVQATHLVLKRGERRVYAYQGEQELASFPVAVGKPGWETPVGTFEVKTMVENPGWTHPFTGKVMSPESANPLGERWIEFWTDGYNSIGFHGTPNRASVGQAASHGCVRMYNEDIQELFNWVSEGTPVIVEQ